MSIQDVFNKIAAFPVMPMTAQNILSLDINDDLSEARLISYIAGEPVLLAKIVGAVNTAGFNRSGCKVNSARDAVRMLGMKRAKALAMSFSMLSVTDIPGGGINPKEILSHSLCVATFMQVVSARMPRSIRPEEDDILLMGMLHDIGFIVLNWALPSETARVWSAMRAHPERDVLDIESEFYPAGVNHCEVGSCLLAQWGLPEEVVVAVAEHHSPREIVQASAYPMAHLLSFTERTLPSIGMPEFTSPVTTEEEWLWIGIEPHLVDDAKDVITSLTGALS